MPEDLPYWLAAVRIPKLQPWQFLQLLTTFPDMQAIFTADTQHLLGLGCSQEMAQLLKKPPWTQVEADLRWLQAPGHGVVTIQDPGYPPLLKHIYNPPLVLFARGKPELLLSQQIAMVGTRHPTPSGLKHARSFAAELAAFGLCITSGLALGIDGACHQGALSAGGATIAVCGSGLDRLYPKAHLNLAERIVQEEGLLLSEFPPLTPPYPSHFPRRNRLISGMSLGVVVVEAALKSGSLITARLALDEGREVFALPGPINQPQTKGCHHLIKQGATLVETVADIGNALNVPLVSNKESTVTEKEPLNLSKQEQAILSHIGYEITSLDMIILRSGLTAGEVSSMLLALEMAGIIQVVPGGYVRESKV